jgi:predicted SprT family Zn-dependent metalloprotease
MPFKLNCSVTMNTIEQIKTMLTSLGMAFRNKYAEWPKYVILGTKERAIIERYNLSVMLPSDMAKGVSAEPKTYMGFDVISSKEKEFFAVCMHLITEKQFHVMNTSQKEKTDLINGQDDYKAFLGIPLQRIETLKGTFYGIVMCNTEQSPTIDAYSELQQAYDFFNNKLFNGELPKCLITMQRKNNSRGYFSSNRFVAGDGTTMDELALNPTFFGIRSIPETLSTLVHEQCHVWQQHFGKISRNGYHNKEWGDKMESIGLMPSATGLPDGARVGQAMTHYIIDGGLFEQACMDPVSTQFKLSWYDRFPPVTEADFKSSVASAVLPARLKEAQHNLAQHSSVLSFVEDPMLDPDSDIDGVSAPIKKKNLSNRVKYQCPKCKTNMWGAPDRLVLCGEDDCEKAPYMVVE